MKPTAEKATGKAAQFGHVDPSTSPPGVEIPRRYNAAVDFVDRHVAEGRGERVAIIDDVGTTTYAALAERTSRVAGLLEQLGVMEEQRALLCLHDTADFPAVFFGAIKAGVVPVPVNTLLTSEDYAFLLADSRARVLFVSDALWPKLEPAIAVVERRPEVVIVPSPMGGPDGGHRRLGALLDGAPRRTTGAATSRDDVAFWLYSSGSTGTPKGTLHLQSSLLYTAALYGRGVLGVREDDIVFSAAKLFFAYGLGNALTFPFHVGTTAVLMAERPTPTAVMRRLHDYEATVFAGVPTLFASILASPELDATAGSRKLRVSISAGEALPKHIGERWYQRFGSAILDGIGSTEMLHIFISNRHGEARYGTTGKPVPGYDVKLVDDAGEPVPDGEEGSLWVRGPSSAIGYWNQRERTIATFHGPWTRTGDRYVRDADGYFTYSGRADDMLKVGGIWVSPFEVESALAAHEAVLEAAVVGQTDGDGLTKPSAYIVLRPGHSVSESLESELKAFVKTRLAPFKYPRWITFLEELPKTATGKIQRYKLR
ncbi:MAG: benzoate-CoA ligase family protein [Polyangiaceae bacterium]|nr:benzoate-CoA ligase family protein [Polyangiaceae bacterium]